jgi:integral membrane protein
LYRFVSVAEAITWSLLILGMLLKYVAGAGQWGVQIGGFVHGLVFLAYGMTAVFVGVNQHWSLRLIALACLTAIIPFATIPFDRSLERRGALEGGWRHTRTDDPRDHTRVSALLRWMLARPVLLAGSMGVALAAIMATLLALGPPGGSS